MRTTKQTIFCFLWLGYRSWLQLLWEGRLQQEWGWCWACPVIQTVAWERPPGSVGVYHDEF
jgi:hypothetical protein